MAKIPASQFILWPNTDKILANMKNPKPNLQKEPQKEETAQGEGKPGANGGDKE